MLLCCIAGHGTMTRDDGVETCLCSKFCRSPQGSATESCDDTPKWRKTVAAREEEEEAEAGPLRVVPFRWIGSPPARSELAEPLREIVGRYAGMARPGGRLTRAMWLQYAGELEKYVSDFPESPYNPSVRNYLAGEYSSRLHYRAALAHWRQAAAEADAIGGMEGGLAAAEALGRYSRHLLIAGEVEALREFFGTEKERMLDGGAIAAMWARTGHKFRNM